MKRQARKNKTRELRKHEEIAKHAKRSKGSSQAFWNEEYAEGGHLALSDNPSEDLEKFARWLEREEGRASLNPTSSVVDLGCGNGRNLIFLGENFGMHGVGFDISNQAVSQATKKTKSKKLQFTYHTQSIGEPIPVPDNSQTLVLDMMTSHFLNEEQRVQLRAEIFRMLKPGGWFFFKTFLLDEDRHAQRLLRSNPAAEHGSYIHPEIGVAEHVMTEYEIAETFESQFIIHKVSKSHRHLQDNKAFKRRSVSVYMQKRD